MFDKSSTIYDLIYSFKDYKKESEEITDIIRTKNNSCKTILDIGCGTAEHHRYLKNNFTIDGLDLNQTFIETARTKNAGGEYYIGNMCNFNLLKKYDTILCLFSSIGYLKTNDELVSAFNCFKTHLNTNGLVILEPWFTVENFHTGKIGMATFENEDVKICRMSHSYPKKGISVLDFSYMVTTRDKGTECFKERHELTMFSKNDILKAFDKAGFKATYDEKGLIGRGMYYASIRS